MNPLPLLPKIDTLAGNATPSALRLTKSTCSCRTRSSQTASHATRDCTGSGSLRPVFRAAMGVPEPAGFGDPSTVGTATNRSISQVLEEIYFWHMMGSPSGQMRTRHPPLVGIPWFKSPEMPHRTFPRSSLIKYEERAAWPARDRKSAKSL